MVRDFIDSIPRKLPEQIPGYWITGKSMIKIWRKYLLARFGSVIKFVPIANRLFGPKVTVTGLLSGKDILAALLKQRLKKETIILPPNCLNHDGLFIDDLTIVDLEQKLDRRVIQGSYNFQETMEMVV
jgi:NifB/MoaA-like Fe-S oxidoreductase